MSMQVSKEAIEQICNLRASGYTLDFTEQGKTPSGLDFCRADDGAQSLVIYACGAALHPSVDYMEEIERFAYLAEDVVEDDRHQYCVAIGAA